MARILWHSLCPLGTIRLWYPNSDLDEGAEAPRT